jgi:UPF0755 protein
VILASIVEKEAQADTERAIIASVFMNRLKKGINLESCATINYVLDNKHRKRVLLFSDLKTDSPYNTYRNLGLPPGPIANPGLKSLAAAVNPASIGYLYFVAKGDGGHLFSYTLDDHNTATARIKRQNGR